MPSTWPASKAALAAALSSKTSGVGVGLDDVLDVVEARRADGGAELGALAGRRARWPSAMSCPSARDDGLLDLVVAVGEVDDLVALGGDRVLLDVEVVVLVAGGDGLVEAGADPGDVVRRRCRAPRRRRRRRRPRSPRRLVGSSSTTHGSKAGSPVATVSAPSSLRGRVSQAASPAVVSVVSAASSLSSPQPARRVTKRAPAARAARVQDDGAWKLRARGVRVRPEHE